MEAGVSVIICTYNGAALIPETLRRLAKQQVPPDIPWEVLVIDNASTDQTAAIANSVWKNSGNPTAFFVHYEPKAGLSFARETGLAKARYEFVLFCDDDNWLCNDYIAKAFALLIRHPEIGMLGGHGELVYQESPPHWAELTNLFASGSQAKKSGKVQRNIVYGAGSVMRQSAFRILVKAGFQSRLTDRKGASLSSGGDYELCYALALAGYQIWYEEQLHFGHFIPAKRITWEYYERYFRESAKSFTCLVPYRFVVNKNCSTVTSFHLQSFKTVVNYTQKLLPALLKHLFLPSESKTAQANYLLYLSLKAKLKSFRQYRTMLQNFRELLLLSTSIQQKATAQVLQISTEPIQLPETNRRC